MADFYDVGGKNMTKLQVSPISIDRISDELLPDPTPGSWEFCMLIPSRYDGIIECIVKYRSSIVDVFPQLFFLKNLVRQGAQR